MRKLILGSLLLAAVTALSSCASGNRPTTAATPPRNTAGLLDTYWRLGELGGQQISTPDGAREIHMILGSENQRVSGFSGCNRMTGGFVLNGESLRFDQMAGTLMACAQDPDLEKRFLAMFAKVRHWEISGETLRLLDDDGNRLATFQARPAPPG